MRRGGDTLLERPDLLHCVLFHIYAGINIKVDCITHVAATSAASGIYLKIVLYRSDCADWNYTRAELKQAACNFLPRPWKRLPAVLFVCLRMFAVVASDNLLIKCFAAVQVRETSPMNEF